MQKIQAYRNEWKESRELSMGKYTVFHRARIPALTWLTILVSSEVKDSPITKQKPRDDRSWKLRITQHYSHHISNTNIDWWHVKLVKGGSHLMTGLQKLYFQVVWEWGKFLKGLILMDTLHLESKRKEKSQLWAS